jgi:hypothetical protein
MKESELSDIEQRMTDDLEWAESALDVQQHVGQLVVVYHKRVVGVGTDQNALLAKAAAQEHCPEEDLVIVLVPRADLQEIPH